jgi:hypothetical protein
MGVGSASVVDYANTYPGTASHVNATGSVGDFEVVVDGSGATTLNLNFQTTTTLDPRITFSRTSNATVVGSNGLIQYAPHNLLTYSEQFDNAAWTKNNVIVSPNIITALDGTLTADLFTRNNVLSYITQVQSRTAVAAPFSFSVYAKQSVGNYCAIRLQGTYPSRIDVVFNLSTGTISFPATNYGLATGGIATIQTLSGGYFRITIAGTLDGLSTNVQGVVSFNSNNVVVDGNDSVTNSAGYLWGAQLNEGALQPYCSTTVKNLLGYSQDFENAAWTKSSSSVLYNLESYSQQFSNAFWNKAGGLTTVTDNFTTAPDGTTTATKWTEVAGTGSHHIHDLVGSYTPVIGLPYTMSMYLKQTETNPDRYVQMTFWLAGFSATAYANFDMQTGTVAFQGASITNATIEVANSGWYRLSITSLATATGASGWQVAFVSSGTAPRTESYTVTAGNEESYYLWGAQVVASPSAENYTVTTSASAPIQAIGPFGFNGGEKLVENTAASIGHYIQPLPSLSFTVGRVLTYSIYAKAAERTFLQLILTDVGPGGANLVAGFDLTNGVAGPPNAGTSTIVPIGNGWFRCSFTISVLTVATTSAQIRLSATSSSIPSSYTGNGTSGIYIFGAQLSDSASLDPYRYNPVAAPTSTAYYGPRFDYDPKTLAPKGLLIEEQRTNLVLNSDTISTQSVTVTAQAYTLSFYGTGTITLSGTSTGSLVGTGAYPNRVSLPFTPTAGTLTLTVTGSVRYAQLEAGAFPTSYTPTTSATVTRAADNASMVGSNFSSWYNQSAGTIYAKADVFSASNNVQIIQISDGTNNNRNQLFGEINAAISWYSMVGGTNTMWISAGNRLANTSFKIAGAIASNNGAVSLNGGNVITDNTVTVPLNLTMMSIGCYFNGTSQLNGHIQSIKYYPKRLPNADLQRLTR